MAQIRDLRAPRQERPALVNYDAELALLAGLIANNVTYFRCSQIVQPGHFADALNGRIFEAIGRIVVGGGRADVLTLVPMFERDPAFPSADQAKQYLIRVASGLVTILNLHDYAEAIRDLWLRRQLLEQADKLVAEAGNFDHEADETIANTARDLYELGKDGRHTARTRREVALELYESLEKPLACCSTGIGALDAALGGGLYAGKLYGLSGRKKAGKSALLGTISYNLGLARPEPIPHLLISLEMTPLQVEQRNAARASGISAMAYLRKPTNELRRMTADYAASVPENTIYEHTPGASLDQVMGMIGRAIVRHRIKGAIIDYWQLVMGKAKGDNEEQHLRTVAQTFFNFASRHGIWMLVGCQLNQEGNTRGGEGLRLACDMLMALHREAQSELAWLEMQDSRYTPYQNIGSEQVPGLWLHKHGPFFDEAPPPAAQMQGTLE